MQARPAIARDVPEIQELIHHFADRGEMLHRPLTELYEHLRDYFVVREHDELLGVAALHVNWEDLAELKGLAVREDQQGRGLGRVLAEACLEDARRLGIATVYALTLKPGFFEKLGFRRIDPLSLDRKVWGECYRCPKFPYCDEIPLIYEVIPGSRRAVERSTVPDVVDLAMVARIQFHGR